MLNKSINGKYRKHAFLLEEIPYNRFSIYWTWGIRTFVYSIFSRCTICVKLFPEGRMSQGSPCLTASSLPKSLNRFRFIYRVCVFVFLCISNPADIKNPSSFRYYFLLYSQCKLFFKDKYYETPTVVLSVDYISSALCESFYSFRVL